MRKTWNPIPMIAFAVVAMILLVSVPAVVQANEVVADQPYQADDAAVVADSAAVNSEVKGFMRLSESPGGVGAKVVNSEKVTDNSNAVPSGGAVGLASLGIRVTTPKM